MIGRGAVLSALSFVLLASCSTDTDLSNRPLFDDGVNVFEAQVINGLTGEVIVSATVTIQVGRHTLESRNDDGFHTVYGIPYGTFRVNATAPDMVGFNATKAFTSSSRNDRLSDGDPYVYYFNNIVMYPTGTAPADVRISVFDSRDGSAVEGATVVAALSSPAALITITDALAGSVGILPNVVSAVTGSDGVATVSASGLIMGSSYLVDVFGALDSDGVYLVPENNRTIIVGQDLQEVVVFLSRPQLSPVSLGTNNEEDQIVNELTATFPYPVDLCSDSDDHTWTNSTWIYTGNNDTDLDGVTTAPPADDPVTVTFAENDTVLTLGFVAETDDPGDDLYVTFDGITLKPRGSSDASCTALTAVGLRAPGGTPNIGTEIHVREIP